MSFVGDDRARLDVGPAALTSPDGLVRATAGATGALGQLEFAPDTFERTTPAQLALTVQALVQRLSDAPLTDARPPQLPRPAPRRARRRAAPPQPAVQPHSAHPDSARLESARPDSPHLNSAYPNSAHLNSARPDSAPPQSRRRGS